MSISLKQLISELEKMQTEHGGNIPIAIKLNNILMPVLYTDVYHPLREVGISKIDDNNELMTKNSNGKKMIVLC